MPAVVLYRPLVSLQYHSNSKMQCWILEPFSVLFFYFFFQKNSGNEMLNLCNQWKKKKKSCMFETNTAKVFIVFLLLHCYGDHIRIIKKKKILHHAVCVCKWAFILRYTGFELKSLLNSVKYSYRVLYVHKQAFLTHIHRQI